MNAPHVYSIAGIFSPVKLIVASVLIVEKQGHRYDVNRQEAANILRNARRNLLPIVKK